MGRESRRKREQRANRTPPTPGSPHPLLEAEGLGTAVRMEPGPNAVEFKPLAWLQDTRATLEREGVVHVPCDGCTACCRHAEVPVHEPLDNIETYQTERRPNGDVILRRRPDGSCIYLIDDKCSIYERRPFVCRSFDCRMYVLLGVVPNPKFKPIVDKASEKFRLPETMTSQDQDTIEALRMAFGFAVSAKKMDVEDASAFAFGKWQDFLPAVQMSHRVQEHLQSLPPDEREKAIAEIQRAASRRTR